MIVIGWNNGDHQKSGAGYGVKLNADNRDRFFTEIGGPSYLRWKARQIN